MSSVSGSVGVTAGREMQRLAERKGAEEAVGQAIAITPEQRRIKSLQELFRSEVVWQVKDIKDRVQAQLLSQVMQSVRKLEVVIAFRSVSKQFSNPTHGYNIVIAAYRQRLSEAYGFVALVLGQPIIAQPTLGQAGQLTQLLDQPDVDGQTRLIRAAIANRPDAVRDLCLAGANIHAVDSNGATALFMAASRGHEVVVERLVAADANMPVADKIDALITAAMEGRVTVVKKLLAAGVDVNSVTKLGGGCMTALIGAVLEGKTAIVALLLEATGIKLDQADKDGRTALFHAADKGREAIVASLLAAGADANVADARGYTPLMAAAYSGHQAVVRRLLTVTGIELDAADKEGRTAVIHAYKQHRDAIGQLLEDAGAYCPYAWD